MDSRCHKPDKSGLPSGVRGVGAARFGLPSSLRGMPGVGCFNHCAPSGVVNADKSTAKAIVFISCLLRIANQDQSRVYTLPKAVRRIYVA